MAPSSDSSAQPANALHPIFSRIPFLARLFSRGRDSRIALTGLANGLSTGIAALTGLASIGIAVPYLGPEQYGLWVSALSWIQLLGIADLGIGNSLVNELAQSYAADDKDRAGEAVSTSLFLTSAAGLLVLVLTLLVLALLQAAGHGLAYGPGNSAWSLTIVILVATAIDLPLGTPGRVYLAVQEGYLNALWTILGSLLGLAGVYAGIHLRLPLPYVAGGALFGRAAAKAGSFVAVLVTKPWLRPRISGVSRRCTKQLLGLGIWYFAANIGFMLESQILYLVGPTVIGLAAVGEAAIVHRVYATVLAIPMLFLAPLWPAYAEALHRNDHAWVRSTLAHARWLGAISTVVAVGGVTLAGPTGLRWWLHGKIMPSRLLLASGGLWLAMRLWREVHTTLLSGAGRLRGQGTYGVVSAGLQAILASVFGRAYGAPGVFLGWFLGFALISGILLVWECHLLPQVRRLAPDAT